MTSRALAATLSMMTICSLSLPLAAQSASPPGPNPAVWQSTPDATALGSGGRGFLSYGHNEWDGEWMLSGGLGLFGGMLHATYGEGSLAGFPLHEYAIGYARRLQDWNLGPWMSWGAGFDLTAASQHSLFSPNQAEAVRLMVPLSFRLGSPSGFSIAPYAGPYAEFGSAQLFRTGGFSPGNNHSTGLAFGGEITAWRLGLTVGALGIPDGMRAFRPGWLASGTFRIRF